MSTPAGTWSVHAQADPGTPLTFSKTTDGSWTLTRDGKVIASSTSGESAYLMTTDLAGYSAQYTLSYSSGFQPDLFRPTDAKAASSLRTSVDPTFLIVQAPPDVTGYQATQTFVVSQDSK